MRETLGDAIKEAYRSEAVQLMKRAQNNDWGKLKAVSGPKIAIADLPAWVRPERAPFRYPSYSEDRGIEQDFLQFLTQEYPHYVETCSHADLIYIPVFWTRLHLMNGYGASGVQQLQRAVAPILSMNAPKFTVCQYDDGPLVDLGDSVIFLASRKTDNGFDVPLLASPLPTSRFIRAPQSRDIRASFAGRLDTHPVRRDLYLATRKLPDVRFHHNLSARRYARVLARSKVALAPRGYGGSSFRFFEALQMGAVPWLIGDIDVRPFRSQLDWDSLSFYSATVDEFVDHYSELSDQEINEKVHNVRDACTDPWTLGKWCPYLIDELRELPWGKP